MNHFESLSVVIAAAALISNIVVLAWVAPLRKLREEVEYLRAQNIGEKQEAINSRLERLEAERQQCLAELPNRYVSRHEFALDREEVRQSRSKMFEMLEELLQRTAHLVGYGDGGKN